MITIFDETVPLSCVGSVGHGDRHRGCNPNVRLGGPRTGQCPATLRSNRGLIHGAEHPRLMGEILVEALAGERGFVVNPRSLLPAAAGTRA